LRGHAFSSDEIAIIHMCADELARATHGQTVT
jgi:hypothetical protein